MQQTHKNPASSTLADHQKTAQHSHKTAFSPWISLASLTVLAIYFFLFMEWLFFVTKPSFMDYMTFADKLGVLLLPGLLLSAISAPALLVLYGLSRLPLGEKIRPLFLWAGAAIPAAILASTGLMWADNFTHTVLRFSIVNSRGYQRVIYAALFLLLAAALFRWAGRKVLAAGWLKQPDLGAKVQLYSCAAVLILSLPLGAFLFRSSGSTGSGMPSGAPTRQPNILLIGTDGLNAVNTSIYGDQPDTTPFLKGFAGEALLAKNNFANATITTGSLVSMFSSKLPTQTRMLYPPDILQGNDSFQHLPGILKNSGYYSATIGIDYYADPEMLNLQDGFVMINGRSDTMPRLYALARTYLPENAAYFISVVGKRLRERVYHIFFLTTMSNPYAEVTQQLSTMSDEDRLGFVVSLYRDIHQPLFIHTHLMGTHITEMDGYVAGITHYDQLMSGLVKELELMGQLENTLIVVYTDHGHNNTNTVRLPLMIRFPNKEHAGVITSNTQNLDVAPTILEYLGIQQPEWMEGVSLLQGEPPAGRPVFSVAPSYRVDKDDRLQLDLSKIKPPFYQFGKITMMVCQNWYTLDTTDFSWNSGVVEGYLSPCPAEELPNEARAREMIASQLEADGFDVASLK